MDLSELFGYCRGLDADKVTDRKKNVEKLRLMLNKSYVLQCLDKNTDMKISGASTSRNLTWDDVFKAVCSYVALESSALQKGRESQSATSLSNKEKKKQEIGSLMKLVIKMTDKRGPRMKCVNVIRHISDVLQDPFSCEAYGLDYSNILLKNILTVRKYCNEIPTATWHELISMYCKLYVDALCGIDRMVLIRVICALIKQSSQHCDMRPKRLLAFFAEVFKNIKQEKAGCIELLVAALNVFTKSIAINSRLQICKLGEAIFTNLLYLWASRPSDALKIEIVEFFRIQIHSHHPLGRRKDVSGSFAVDWDVWTGHLRRLYGVVKGDLEQIGGRNRFSTAGKDAALTHEYIDLAADVCNQLFSEKFSVIEVTQVGADIQWSSTKRRPIELGWSFLRDKITCLGQTLQTLPWLQLLKRLIEKYPQNIPEDEFLPFLNLISQLLSESKRNEIADHILSCALSIIKGWKQFKSLQIASTKMCESVLQKMWTSTLRMVSLHHAEAMAYRLLTAMLEASLIKPECEIWSLFLPSNTTPTQGAIDFLSTYLVKYDLPEHYRTTMLGAVDSENSPYNLRIQLIDWLLPCHEDVGDNKGKVKDKQINLDTMSCVIALLVLKSSVKDFQEYSHETDELGTELERVYLQISIDLPLPVERLTEDNPPARVLDNTHLPVLLKKIEESFQIYMQSFSSITEPELSSLEDMSVCCCVLGKFIHWLLHFGILSDHTVTKSDLVDIWKSALKKFTSLLMDFIAKEGTSQLKLVVPLLLTMFGWESGDDTTGYIAATICRWATPNKLIDQLGKIITEVSTTFNVSRMNVDGPRHQRNSDLLARKRRRVLEDFDDMDIEFDNAVAQDQGEDLCFEEEEMRELQDSQEDSLREGEVNKSILSREILTEAQQLRLDAVQVLCKWGSHTRVPPSVNLPIHAEVLLQLFHKKLEEVFDEKTFDASQPLYIQMMSVILSHLARSYNTLSDTHLKIAVNVLRKVIKFHRQDQDVCCMCLGMLTQIIPHLHHIDNSLSLVREECRDVILHLVSAFWTLQEDGNYIPSIRLAIAMCMETLLKYDPASNWTILTLKAKNNEEDTETSVAEEFPFCLSDPCHSVRSFAASSIANLFVCQRKGGTVPLERSRQIEMFDKIYTTLQDSLDIKTKLSPERAQDEMNNRTASILSALGTVIIVSPVCEKRALFALCQLIKENGVEINPVKKVLQRVAKVLKYNSIESFLASHLPYLVNQWLNLKYAVSEFPQQLLLHDSKVTFYQKYYQILIPELMMHKKVSDAQEVVKEMKQEWLDVLKLCIPKIIVHILPLFAATKSEETGMEENVKRRTAHASICYDLLLKELTKEVVDKTIVSNLDELVVNILMCLHDNAAEELSVTGHIRNMNPEPNPPHYNTYVTTSTLDYLTGSFSGNAKSLVDVLSESQDAIQKILVSLASRLSCVHRMQDKYSVLCMYRLFVNLLLNEFDNKLGGSLAYTLREILYRPVFLIHNMNILHRKTYLDMEYRQTIVCVTLDLLRHVCTVTIKTCPQMLSKYLSWLCCNLVPLVEVGEEIGEQSLSLLKFLVVDNSTCFEASISNLDPFPENAAFQQLAIVHKRLKDKNGAFTLREEIEKFLLRCEMRTSSGNSHVEGLKFLWQQLSTCQKELTELVKECEENQSGSILCRFICELVSMLTDASEDLRLVVSQCLGEIGPVDLSTVCLPKDKRLPGLKIALDCFKDSSEQQEYCWLFHLLNSYIIDSSMEVVQSAVQVLKSMLSTQTGISFASAYKDCLADDDHLFSYLHPFLAKKKTSLGSVKSRTQEFLDIVDSEDVWIPCHGNHVQWLRNLSLALIRSGAVRNELLRLVGPVCTHKSDFCEVVLPFLIHDILLQGSDLHTDVLSRQIAKFFTLHLSRRGDQDSTRSRTPMSSYDQVSICDNKDSIRTLLNTIQYLRQQTLPRRGHSPMTPYDNNFWLDIDYLQASRAAQYCSAQFTALLYAEIWCATNKDHTESKNFSQSLSQDTRIEALSIASSDSGLSVQNVLLDAYRQIGDPDGVYGCGAGRLADSISRIQTYQHENLWEKAVITQDIETCNQGYTSQIGILKALQNMGAAHLLDMYLQGVSNSGPQTVAPEIEEFHYEAAWKMGKWNLTRPARLSESCGFQQALYTSLCSLKDGHDTLAASAVKSARLCCVQSVGTMSVESSRCLYPLLASLHCLNQVQEAIDATRSREKSVVPLLKKWKSSCVRLDNDFEFVEPVYNTKSTLCKLLGSWIKDEQLHSAFVENLLKFAEVARQANRNQFAERIIHELRSTEISKMDLYVSTLIEEASLYWARAEHNTAKHLMKVLLDKLHLMKQEKNEAAKFYPMALGIYGNWLAETRSESPNVIMENYLEKTVQLLESASQEGETALDAYLSLARYADSQYQSIINFMKSTTYEAKQNLMKKAQADAEKLQELGDCSRDRYYRTLVKQFEIDEKEVARMKEDKMKFLVKAVQNYIKCLKCGDKHDLRIFRLISLWFTNASFGQLNLIIQEGLPNIKSYKFLPLMYQLAARLNVKQQRDTSSSFQPTLTKIIERAAVEHPHHTLNCILALANANKDAELTQQGKSIKRSGKLSRTQSDPDSGDQGRVQAAKNLVEKLKSSKDYRKVAVTVLNMERLSSAYIQLANFPVDQYKRETKPIALSSSLWINQLKNLSSVALPTTEMKVDPMGDYKSILYITGFQSTFQLAGGINLPKIITCLGSDGVARRQLVKGRDDLRQDAVMQQVFGMVNSLLRKNTETRKRKMHVRTYKVIPLSQRSGLLEWCEGTQPIGEYLIGRNGAHSRYQPKDWAAIDCRNYMQEVQKSNLASKVQHFLKACKNFQPVMRHFFMEKFSDPASWYEHRVAYTRSVATTSIVGYILGLGDRHVQNILIDSNTAELVHIDLGVAFEQGRILPTPETVPFRLTRDIVDGMGVLGVEGVFRRCCEKTMEVMHDNQEALLTILEVLLYDPLYAWTISPARAFALQQRRDKNVEPEASELNSTTGDIMDMQSDGLTDAQENVNKTAERALLRLQQKLQGIEDSIQLSVSGQVNLLIQEARDPKNLARLFPGWQPYI